MRAFMETNRNRIQKSAFQLNGVIAWKTLKTTNNEAARKMKIPAIAYF
jgi:hypothetical protein